MFGGVQGRQSLGTATGGSPGAIQRRIRWSPSGETVHHFDIPPQI